MITILQYLPAINVGSFWPFKTNSQKNRDIERICCKSTNDYKTFDGGSIDYNTTAEKSIEPQLRSIHHSSHSQLVNNYNVIRVFLILIFLIMFILNESIENYFIRNIRNVIRDLWASFNLLASLYLLLTEVLYLM